MNTIRIKLVWIVVIAMSVGPAWGRLGETPDRCDQRYGLDFTQKGPDGCWAFSRDYKKNDISVTVRFIYLPGGNLVAGWISYTPSFTMNDKATMMEKIREASSNSWKLMEETKITPDLNPKTAEQIKGSNKDINETRGMIMKIIGWGDIARYWSSPSSYAANNGYTLVMFSNNYLSRYERVQAHEEKIKDGQKPISLPVGF